MSSYFLQIMADNLTNDQSPKGRFISMFVTA